jgi:hypothetical protein
MPIRHSLLALCILASLTGGTAIAAAPAASPPPFHLWSGLIYATNPLHPAQASDRLRTYVAKLKHIFGYNQYDLVGESSQRLDGLNERWLIPSKDFYMSVQPRQEPGDHYPATVTLFQARRKVVEFETHLSPDSPLFIRGPLYGGGQLFMVIHMVSGPAPTPAVYMQERPAAVIVGPTPFVTIVQRRQMPVVPMATIPPRNRAALIPPPAHFGPSPPDRFPPGFGPGFGPREDFGTGGRDRVGPLPGALDPKLNRP